GARRDAGARLLRTDAADVAPVQAAAGRDQGPPSDHHRRGARRGPARRRAHGRAERRAGRRAARREAARGRGRRQRGAAAAAAHRRGGRDRRRHRPPRPRRDRARAGARPQAGQGGGRMSDPAIRHFLDLIDIPPRELRAIIDASRAMKKRGRATRAKPLAGRMLAMIFDKPSTRTRVSFDVAMRQLGGDVIVLTGHDMQLGRGETTADTAKVLSRYVDAIMIRTLDHAMLLELARYATVPVINGLTRRSHPCQVMADVLTFEEHRGPIKGKTVAWTGDANNVLA